MFVYLIYLSVFFLPPVLILGWILQNRWKHAKHTLFWALVFIYTFGFVWDWLAVRTGVWRYDTAPTLDIWFAGLPIEEFVGFYVLSTLLIVEVALLFSKERNENV